MFWGGFDLAHQPLLRRTRPAARPGRRADPRFGEDQANFAVGFWTCSGADAHAAFYAYVSPAPDGVQRPAGRARLAASDGALGEFLLPYDELRRADVPEAALLAFFQAAYEAWADLGGWDRQALEGDVPALPGPAGAA